MRYFETRFLDEVDVFLAKLDPKTVRKIIYNIDLAEQTNDPKLFKKLQYDIWKFRTIILGQNRQQRNIGNCNTWFRKESGQRAR